MKLINKLKILANETRMDILRWLNDPKKHFPDQVSDVEKYGACVGLIEAKSNVAQSTVSLYLKQLEQAGFVDSLREGKWTYYKLNRNALDKVASDLRKLGDE